MQKSSTDATSDHCGTVRNSSNTNRFRPSKFIASREDMAVEEATVTADTTKENCESCSSPFPLVFFFLLMFVFDGCVRGRSSSLSLTSLKWDRFEVRTRQFVRVVKETDSKSVGLCPRKFESCSCRFFAPLFFSFRFILLFHFITLYHITFHFITFLFSFHYSLSHPISNKHPVKELLLLVLHVLLAHHHRLLDFHSLASRLDHLDLLHDRRALLLQHAQRLAITPHSLDHLGQQHRRGNTARRFHREDEVVPNHFQLH